MRLRCYAWMRAPVGGTWLFDAAVHKQPCDQGSRVDASSHVTSPLQLGRVTTDILLPTDAARAAALAMHFTEE